MLEEQYVAVDSSFIKIHEIDCHEFKRAEATRGTENGCSTYSWRLDLGRFGSMAAWFYQRTYPLALIISRASLNLEALFIRQPRGVSRLKLR